MADVNESSQFYLHTNGKIIYKPNGGIIREEGGFVKAIWDAKQVGSTPENFCNFLLEAKLLGADMKELVSNYKDEIDFIEKMYEEKLLKNLLLSDKKLDPSEAAVRQSY